MKADGHDPAIIGYAGLSGNVINYNGIPVFPAGLHPYGQDIWGEHTRRFGADIMFSLTDSWVIETQTIPYGFHWIPWYPVDHNPMPPAVRDRLSHAYRRIAMSKYGVQKTHEAGLDCYYIPHGVDTKQYHPIDKQEAREYLKLPKDAYIIGTVGMNKGASPSRKAFVEMIEAFTLFKQTHKNALYLLHTSTGEGMDGSVVHFKELCAQNGLQIGKDVVFTDPYYAFVGAPPEFMANLYSAMDVFLLTSMGEGFGIPILEAQACGVPVIVGDWTAMSELCFSGHKIDVADTHPFYTAQGAYQYFPDVKAIERKLQLEKAHPSSREKARKGALEYDADLVYERDWKPVLKDIEESLK
jgi:glycosyltransferase involved in cell wall biosynthesis